MKITFISPANMSGGVRVIALYAQKLTDLGHDVQVFSVQEPRLPLKARLKSLSRGKDSLSRPGSQPSYLDKLGVNYHLLPHSSPVTDTDLPDADIVIATWWETANWVAGLSPAKGMKVYFMQDYGAPGQEIEKIAPTWRLPLYIITISEGLARLVQDHNGGAKPVVVANSVDTGLFQGGARRKAATPTVGFMYRPSPSKGVDIVVAAVRRARETIPDLKVVAFGSKPATRAQPLPEQTTYYQRPADTELAAIYSASDAWIFPSRKEGFGLPILEAMACGTPVIAMGAGAAPELITGKTGILLPGEDSDAMARAIIRTVGLSDADWRAMSDAALEKSHGYTWDDAARAFEAELQKAVGRAP